MRRKRPTASSGGEVEWREVGEFSTRERVQAPLASSVESVLAGSASPTATSASAAFCTAVCSAVLRVRHFGAKTGKNARITEL